MKVLLVSTNDRSGGAAIGAYRLHQALQRNGVESEMLVLRKVTADPSAHRLSAHLDRWGRIRRRLAEYRHHRQLAENPRLANSGHWSLNLFSSPIAEVINSLSADIVHLQWVGDGYLPISALAKIKAPLVWTLQDMWAFTGGCHYVSDCSHFIKGCGDCPQLESRAGDDISSRVNSAKQSSWSDVSMTVVCLSRWLADCARSSMVMKDRRIEVIGNLVDPNVFKPHDNAVARRAFNLPPDKRLILFGAIGGTNDPRKCFAYLRETLLSLGEDEDVELVVFGGAYPADLQLQLPTHHIGQLQDEVSLSLLYAACDVYVLPTLQEAFGNTLVEVIASGTPCVTFDGSGAVDIVAHQRNGYVARLKDTADLLHGVQWTLEQSWSPSELHQGTMAQFGDRQISEQYLRLYRSLLGQPR